MLWNRKATLSEAEQQKRKDLYCCGKDEYGKALQRSGKAQNRAALHCKAKEPLGKALQWNGEALKRIAKQRNGKAKKRVAMERRSTETHGKAIEKLRVDSIGEGKAKESHGNDVQRRGEVGKCMAKQWNSAAKSGDGMRKNCKETSSNGAALYRIARQSNGKAKD